MKNNELIKTHMAAMLAGVSESTIKRWSVDGKLTTFRDANGHRLFSKNEIIGLIESRKKMKKAKSLIKNKIQNAIQPQSHPAHYLMHKYWGRKPHNVVSAYIENYSEEGDTILDPFMGSGVTVIESAKLKRHAIGIDLNPMSKFIVDNTLNKVNIPLFQKEFMDIFVTIKNKYEYLYETQCPHCEKKIAFSSCVWENSELKSLRINCTTHNKVIKLATTEDILLNTYIEQNFSILLGNNTYPSDPVLQYVKRSGKNSIDELFTQRGLLVLSAFLSAFNKVENPEVRELLLFTFSSALPNCSRMLPGSVSTGSYKSGWVISKFWVPKTHTERNPFECLELRYEAILKGKSQLLEIDPKLVNTYTQNSENLSQIESGSIDYIFTDPPYGESIAYLGLSHLWNSWLGFTPEYKDEIILDSFRNKKLQNFEDGLFHVFKELNRVLKTGKYLSFTFHNRDLKVWKAIIEPVLQNGFYLENVVMQPQAVSSGTQGINKDNTLKGDFIYNFIKESPPPLEKKFKYHENAYDLIKKLAEDYILNKKKVSASELYEYLIPQIVINHAFLNLDGSIIDIEKLLENEFCYSDFDGEYFWHLNKKDLETQYNVLDLFSGAGGFSVGFNKAGFNIVSAVEFDSEIAKTYKQNHQETHLFNCDIRELKTVDVKNIFDSKNLSCDVIIGGPPCQGFSMSGNRIRKNYTGKFDERNELFMEFYRFVKDLKPKFFVIENVEGILNFNLGQIKNDIYRLFESLGYTIDSKVLTASDYGVPQLRKRAFFIGTLLPVRPEELIPEATHSIDKYVSVWDAIGDLPSIQSGEGKDILVKSHDNEYSEYQILMGADKQNVIYNHKASVHNQATIKKMSLIKNGETQSDLPTEFQTKSVHSGAWGRMDKSKPAYTLTTRLNTPSVGRIIHPYQDRTITPREAARLQSFPDSFKFLGGITTVGMQIGNAVSPLLAEKIGIHLKKLLETYNS